MRVMLFRLILSLAAACLLDGVLGINSLAQEGVTDNSTGVITDAFDIESAILRDEKYFEVHQFNGESQNTITIELKSKDFQPYLILLDPNGNKIAEAYIVEDNRFFNDGDSISRIVVTLPSSGAYTIYAGVSYYVPSSSSNSIGTYTLEWRDATSSEEEWLKALNLIRQAFESEDLARYEEATQYFEESLAILRPAYGDDNFFVITVAFTLMELYISQEFNSEAESLIRQFPPGNVVADSQQWNIPSLDTDILTRLFLEDLGPVVFAGSDIITGSSEVFGSQVCESETAAVQSSNAVSLHETLGISDILSPEETRLLQCQELGEAHPTTIRLLFQDANFNWSLGRYEEAEALYIEAASRSRILFERDNLNGLLTLTPILTELSDFYRYRRNFSEAASTLEEALDLEEVYINSEHSGLSSAPEANGRRIINTFNSDNLDRAISLHLNTSPEDTQSGRLAFTTVLRRKGRILEVLAGREKEIQNYSESQRIETELAETQRELSNLTYSRASLTETEFNQRYEDLTKQISTLEGLISLHAGPYQATIPNLSTNDIQSILPSNSVLIEFIRYQPIESLNSRSADFGNYSSTTFGKLHYAAYLLDSEGNIYGYDLGPASEIEPLIADFQVGLRNQNLNVSQLQEAAERLTGKILNPLRSHLENIEHLLISPDGALNLIPFEALMLEPERYLVQDHQISYLTSGRDLLRLQSSSEPETLPLLVADPVFGRPGARENDSAADTIRFSDITSRNFPSLTNTSSEIETIADLLNLPENRILQGYEATEAAIKQVNQPRILHVATHGFFTSTPSVTSTADLDENPLLRSGLVLAGVQTGNSGSDQEDGILTALETSSLNLLGTQLVVFSACETGIGKVSEGEGLYGLRRALVSAGSESQLMSLWQVRDDTTKDLMVSYYERLRRGEGRSEALRNTQLEMLRQESTSHPYYWAPFTISGDWTPLNLPR